MATNLVTWRHVKTGGEYKIIDFVIREADLMPLVLYQRLDGGPSFTRLATEFFDGRFEQQFVAFTIKAMDIPSPEFDIGDRVRLRHDAPIHLRQEWGPVTQCYTIKEVREHAVSLKEIRGSWAKGLLQREDI